MTINDLADKVRGSLIGGAAGDALGYPVEFIYSYDEIKEQYGEGGINEYDMDNAWLSEGPDKNKALFSDDTQMTLYTAEGLLYAEKNSLPILPVVQSAYLYWYGGQMGQNIKGLYPSELAEIDELNQRRAPGNTCISALASVQAGKKPMNNSKGCGGIMRIAPIALYGASHDWPLEKTGKLVGDVAQLTHLHQMSTLASACAAAIIQQCVTTPDSSTAEGFGRIVEASLECAKNLYPDFSALPEFTALVRKAYGLKDSPENDWDIIERKLGGGWVAEETLAIAVFCVARHLYSFSECLTSAVNHGGDSDSTGAVAGNIIGAILGYQAILEKFIESLQMKGLLLQTADALI